MTTFAVAITNDSLSIKNLTEGNNVAVEASFSEVPGRLAANLRHELGSNLCSSKIMDLDPASDLNFFYLSKKFNT